ncbi:MAG TPA: ABC transporter substrate-binding protein [Stellaceae bacterium]|nr:ABC transporter substrate-binding protein [Stellaceae bacterium]
MIGRMGFAVLLGVAVMVPGVAPAAAQGLTAAYYGGSWGEAIHKCIVEPFTKQAGIAVTPEPGVSSVTIAKLQQQKGHPAIDVAWMDGGISELAAAEDLVAPVDPKAVPNVADMIPEGVYHKPDGSIYALSTGFYALGIIYNTKEVKNPPSSWWDLWNSDYSGAVTVPSPTNAMGVPFIVEIAKLSGGGVDNVDPAMKKLKTLKVSSFFDTSGGADNSFQSGEAIIGAHYAQAGWALADKGLPIGYAVPKEGALGGDIRIHIVKGTSKLAEAEKFMNYAVSKDAATCMTDFLYVGPATKGVAPTEKARQRLPWGPNGSVKNLALSDWNKINAARAKITEMFNRDVVGR